MSSLKNDASCPGCPFTQASFSRLISSRISSTADDCLELTMQSLPCWLLLSHTVNGPQSPHEINRVDTNDGPVGNQLGKDPQRYAVVRIVERGDQYRRIRDVEVSITRRKPPPLEQQGRGHR